MEIPAKKGFLSIVLAGCLGLAGCGGGGSAPPPPPPSLSQTVSLVNDVDIHYVATLQSVAQATRTITHDGVEMYTTTISYSPYSETLANREKGVWGFELKSGNLSDTDSLTIPNYDPTANFASLAAGLNQRYEGSSKTFNLEALISDKNPEDRPVPITEARSLDGKSVVSLDGYNLTIRANGTGPYQVEVDFGTDEGGRGSGTISAQIVSVPEQIVFFGATADLYLINIDATGLQRLTNNGVNDIEPYFSPDGSKIVFSSNRINVDGSGWVGNYGLYTINVDGSNPTRVTPNGLDWAASPVWCNNGKILFNYSDFSTTQGIAVINPDGTGFQQVIQEPFSNWLSGRPACSPDGSQIAFTTARDGNLEIYVANADGSGQRNLTNSPFVEADASWSPDGSKIAFETDRDDPGSMDFNFYTINPDGTGLQRLADLPGEEIDLSWSPDASRVVFTHGPSTGPWHIYLMNTDGTGLVQLTTEDQERWPAWRPR